MPRFRDFQLELLINLLLRIFHVELRSILHSYILCVCIFSLSQQFSEQVQNCELEMQVPSHLIRKPAVMISQLFLAFH
jgi:hypothetical protein